MLFKNYDMDLLKHYENLRLKNTTTLEEICLNMMVFISLYFHVR